MSVETWSGSGSTLMMLPRTGTPSQSTTADTNGTGMPGAAMATIVNVLTVPSVDTGTWANSVPPGVKSLLDRVRQYVDLDIDAEYARKFIAERMQTWGSALAASTLVVVGALLLLP